MQKFTLSYNLESVFLIDELGLRVTLWQSEYKYTSGEAPYV